jgi:hypothetical protein
MLLFDDIVGKVHRRTRVASRRIIGTTVLTWYRGFQAQRYAASVHIQRNIRGKLSRVKTGKKKFVQSNKKKFSPLMKHYSQRLVLTHSPNHLLTHSPNHLLTHSGAEASQGNRAEE